MFTCMPFWLGLARINGMEQIVEGGRRGKATLIPAEPLTEENLAAVRPVALATTILRLEEIFRDLIGDITQQRQYSEKGVDPRLIKLQLDVLKEMARLMRLHLPPSQVVDAEEGPGEEERAAELEAKRRMVLDGLDRMGRG